jgi:hypothetical protein
MGSSLFIENNKILSNIDGLSKLSSIGGSLHISNNPTITNLDGLSNLSSVGNIDINNNIALKDLCAVRSMIINTEVSFSFSGNGYNPFPQKFLDGNCSQ